MGKYHNLTWLIKPDFTTYLNLNRFYGMQDIDMIGLFGARGTGKSTALAIRGCSNFEDKDEQIAIIRRYKEQTQASKDYFNKVVADVHTKGICKGAYEYKVGKDTLGFGLTLSLYQNFKSGIDFSKVTTIVFEEYLKTKGSLQRYLKDEMSAVFELISTIVRTRNNYKIFFVSNNVDFFNPLFEFYNVPSFTSSYTDRNKGVYLELIPVNPKLLELEKETPLYKLTQGTAYHDYHYHNALLTSNKVKISVKDIKAVLLCRMVFNRITLNIYRDRNNCIFIEWRDKIIKDDLAYEIMKDNKYNYQYIKNFKESTLCRFIRVCYYHDDVYYNNQKAYEILEPFMELIKA